MSRKHVLVILLTAVLVSPVAANTYSETIQIEPGEEKQLGEYMFYYEGLGEDAVVRIHHDHDSGMDVLKKLEGQEVFNASGETYEFPEKGLTVQMTDVGFDEEGRRIIMDIESREDIFASSEMEDQAPDRVIASREGTVDLTLQLENTGIVDQKFELGTETDSAIKTSFNYQGFNLTEIYVPAGESRMVDAKLEVPSETTVDTHKVKLIAQNRSISTENIDVQVEGNTKERRMDMEMDQMYSAVRSGEETNLRVSLRNSGEARIQDVNITVNGPDSWDLEVEPSSIAEIRPRYGRESSGINVKVPQEAEPGDYIIEVSAQSERVSVEPQEVRVQVREKSGLSSLGVILMAISIGGLVAVYRKFGRR